MADTLIDVSGLKRLARDMRTFDPVAARQLRRAARSAGELVADGARRRASWSRRIPGSVTVKAQAASAKVSAGSEAAPHAAPYEHQGLPGSFRHPVFPQRGTGRESWTWTNRNSNARPFLHPALNDNAEAVAKIIGDEVFAGYVEAFGR